MRGKLKVISVIFCVVVMIGCVIGYSGAVSQLYYEMNTPSAETMVSSCETKVAWTVSAKDVSELGEANGIYDLEGDMDVIEITYELFNPVNTVLCISGNLCYYYGEDGEWFPAYEPDASYSDISVYENCKILPPGESAVFKEYVLVPRGTEEIYACGNWGDTEKMAIKL